MGILHDDFIRRLSKVDDVSTVITGERDPMRARAKLRRIARAFQKISAIVERDARQEYRKSGVRIADLLRRLE